MHTPPVRVLIFVPSLGSGGAEMQALRVANHLPRDRFEVAVAVARGGGSYEPALRPDVALHVVGGRLGALSNTVSVAASIRPLRRLIAEQGYDVVLGFMNHVNVALLAAVRGLRRPPAVVLGVQNNPLVAYRQPRGVTDRVVRRGMDRAYPAADRIVALSEGVRDALLGLLPKLEAERVEVVYNAGVDDRVLRLADEPVTEPVTEHAPESGEPAPLVVACGRLTEQKDYPTLLRAFVMVAEQTRAHLWILGRGEREADLHALRDRLGLTDRVRFLGFRDNPYAYMARADVYALSSSYEGFGNVLVEAMASGTPVVSTDCPYGPGEIIVPDAAGGETGVLVPVGDADALAREIVGLLRDPERAAAIAERGRTRALDFHADRIGAQYGAVLERALIHAASAA